MKKLQLMDVDRRSIIHRLCPLGRRTLRKPRMPRRDLRMQLAPIQMRETKIQIRKTATDCDVANPKSGVRERGGLLLQRSHRGLILGAKSIHDGFQRLRSLALGPPQDQQTQTSVAAGW